MKYYVWLSLCLLNKKTKTAALLKNFGTPENIYNLVGKGSEELCKFIKKGLKSFFSSTIEEAEAVIAKCVDRGIKIIPYVSKEYPKAFFSLSDFPVCIFAFGNTAALNSPVVFGACGARSEYEETFHEIGRLSFEMSRAGAVVCSGLAYGADTAALEGAVLSGGATIGVLGCSIDVNYPMKNRELKKKMLKFGGVLISEYPIETPAYPANFPIRNRLITALSDVLLAAPGENSKGTYITVQKMLDAEKGLCTVSCDKSYSHIAYQKLMLLGAKEVLTSTDVMKLYPVEKRAYLSPEKIISGEYEIRKNAYDNEKSAAKKADETAKKTQKTVKETEPEKEDKSELIEIKRKEIIKNFPKGTEEIPLKIFDIIARKESSIEEIIELSAIPAPEVLDHLIRLQIMGIADTANGKIYKVSK